MTIAMTMLLASHSDGWDHHWWPIWPLLWIAVIVTVVWFARRRWTGDRPQNGVERARGILAERYARGEISGDEYRERLDQLG